jgi:hypothetical protein
VSCQLNILFFPRYWGLAAQRDVISNELRKQNNAGTPNVGNWSGSCTAFGREVKAHLAASFFACLPILNKG